MRSIIYQEVSQWIQLQTNQFVWLPTPVSQNRTPASSSIKPGASDARDIMYIFKLSKCNDALHSVHSTMCMTIRIRTTSSNQRRIITLSGLVGLRTCTLYLVIPNPWSSILKNIPNFQSSFLNETKNDSTLFRVYICYY